MKVAIGTGRAKIDSGLDGLQIAVPARKNWFLIAFLLFWLGGWAMGETMVIRQLLSGTGRNAFLIFWLGGWTIGGGFAIVAWLWNVAGMEYIAIRRGELSHRYAVGPIGWTREYDVTYVKDFRVSTVAIPTNIFGQQRGLAAFGMAGGNIAFDYGAKTCRVGVGLDEAEARQIVDLVKSKYPAL